MGCTASKAASPESIVVAKGEGLVQPTRPLTPVKSPSAAASKVLSQADPAAAPTPRAPAFANLAAPPLAAAPGVSRSKSPTPSLEGSVDGSTRSSRSSGRSVGGSMRGSASALGLDTMIDEKRVAKTLSERIVHIEVPFGKPIEEVYTGVHDGPVLGSGISGLVRLATHKATGIKYAVKCLDLGLVDTEEGLQQLREEIYIMCQLDHPNIVRLEEVYESHSEIYLVQELCLGGELFDRLDEQPDYHYTEAQCARLIHQMLCSVRYIHSKGIIHRDLKLENFLFSDTGADSELKMIDFGLSKHFKFGEVQHEAVGTPYTVAPEVIRGSYDERCDVWAIGVITYLLLSGESPFGGCGGPEPLMQVRDNILKCNFVFEPEEIWENVSDQAKNFIRRVLVTDPNMRPTARGVQKDPWIVDMASRGASRDDSALNPSVVRALVNFKEYSDMRKLLCEVLSFTLIPDQIQGLREEFKKMDADGSGEITLSALKTVLLGNAERGSLGALTEEEVEDIFNAMRVSGTETTIHWHEFIAAGLSHCKVDERNLKLAFDRLDSDHTGYITFENFMDLIGNGAVHSEEALREMWGEASMNNAEKHITYEDFLLLMKGQTKTQPIKMRPTTPMLGKLSLHPVMESPAETTLASRRLPSPRRNTSGGSKGSRGSLHGSMTGFIVPVGFDDDVGPEFEGPVCIEDEEEIGVPNQGITEPNLARPNTPPPMSPGAKARSKSFDSDESAPGQSPVWSKNPLKVVNLPERTNGGANGTIGDPSKSALVVNRELYRAHREMRLAVLEASKRLEEEQQRRAREEMRKEQARSNKAVGLIMRHGGELSADAIKRFVGQQQREDQKKVLDASYRSGRRRGGRDRTASDIRGMFGTSGSASNNLTLPKQPALVVNGGIPNFGKQSSAGAVVPRKETIGSSSSDMPDLPKVRDATKPGQFRKTTYDPFGFGARHLSDSGRDGGDVLESSFHRHMNGMVSAKPKPLDRDIMLKPSGSETDLGLSTRSNKSR